MASTYSTNLGIELIGTGDQSGTWGATTNTNLGTLLEQSIAGYATQAVTDGAATVLTIANGASSTGRNAVIALTGALTAARVVEVPAKTKSYIFYNATTGGFAVTVKVTGQTGVSVPNGTKAIVYCDGTDVRNVLSNVTVDATSGNVGIGTSTPSAKLTVVASTDSGIVVNNGTVNTIIYNSSGGVSSIGTTTNHALQLYTNNAARVTLDSSGNVGIGTSSPSGKLDISTGTTATAINSNNQTDTGFVLKYVSALTSLGNNFNQPLAFLTNNTEQMRIDSSGNVGIGTSSPSSYGIFSTLGSVSNSASALGAADATVSTILNTSLAAVGNKATQSFNFIYGKSVVAGYYAAFNGAGDIGTGLLFGTQETTAGGTVERMRIDQSGNLLVGTTSLPIAATRVGISGASGVSVGVVSFVNTGASTKKWSNGPDANGNFIVYNDASVGMYLGYGNNAWTASSDERAKTDLVPIENAAAKVSSLRAVTGRFKTDEEGKSRSFLIAQDVQAVLPEAVDASDPDKLGVQYTDVIPLLVAAIKELSAKVTALESK